jgi:hypothetical protein
LFETPLALNPAPVTVTVEIVMLEFPLFVSVDVSWLELLTFTVPKLKLVGFAASSRVAATPVPLRLIVNGEGVPLVVSVTDPLMVVAEVGVKMALNVALPPAAIVVDVVSPVMLIPVPDVTMFENVRVALPLFRNVTGCELLLPTTTLEKATLVGDAAICDCPPDPLRGIVNGEGVPLVVSVTDPLMVAVEVGVKTALNVTVPPAATVVDVVSPVMLMPVPATTIFEKVSGAFPLFRRVTGCELLLPTATIENATFVGEAAICA